MFRHHNQNKPIEIKCPFCRKKYKPEDIKLASLQHFALFWCPECQTILHIQTHFITQQPPQQQQQFSQPQQQRGEIKP